MKNLKKVLALVVACAMFFTMSSFAFSDVSEDASYLEAVTMLSKLGIINGYEDGTFLPDNTLTRAEAAKVLVCALNAADQADGMKADELFTDVPADHWAAGYINYCANFGIIAGMGDGTFDPEAPVTYEQIVKMVVAMLGYTPVANVKGGYPTGYLYVANNLIKITKGATGTTGDAAKRWVVARLLFNSLEAKIMEQASWNPNDPDYVQGDQTLLKDYLEVTKIEGVVTDTFYQNAFEDKEEQPVTITLSAIDGYTSDEKLDDDGFDYSVSAEGGEYTIDANGTGAEEYLGYKVLAYVKEFDEGEDELVAIAPRANKNNTLELSFTDFEETVDGKTGVDTSSSKYISFEYFETPDADKVTTGKLFRKGEAAAIWYLNGVCKDEINGDNDFVGGYLEEFASDYEYDGFVKFVDNTGDGVYDYVFVEKIEAEYVAEEITAKSYKVADAISGSTIKLDPTEDDVYVTFYKDDAVVGFDAIDEDDVLSVVYNGSTLKNSSVVKVYISSAKAEGYVSTASSSKNQYKIGGTVYAKTNECAAISRGDEGVFYLNFRGKIAYSDTTTAAGGNYAFLLDVNTEESFSSGLSFTLRFMNEKGEWIDAEIYDTLTCIYYDEDAEQVTKKISDVEDLLVKEKEDDDYVLIHKATNGWLVAEDGELAIGDMAGNRIFQYTLNADGYLTKIVLPYEGLEEDKFSYTDLNDEYDADANRFRATDGKGGVAENTVVFVADVEEDSYVEKKKELSLGSYTTFKDGETYEGYAFDMDDDGIYGCMFITGATNSIEDEANLFVVDEVTLTTEKGEDFFVIAGLINGEEKELETLEETDVTITDLAGNTVTSAAFETLGTGSVIEYAVDGAGYVTDIKVVFDVDSDGIDDDAIVPEDVVYGYGYIGEKASGTAKVIELITDEEVTVLDGIATAGKGMLGTIYTVDLTARNTVISTDTSIADYCGSVTEDMDADEFYCAFVKIFEDDTVDVVVYIVE